MVFGMARSIDPGRHVRCAGRPRGVSASQRQDVSGGRHHAGPPDNDVRPERLPPVAVPPLWPRRVPGSGRGCPWPDGRRQRPAGDAGRLGKVEVLVPGSGPDRGGVATDRIGIMRPDAALRLNSVAAGLVNSATRRGRRLGDAAPAARRSIAPALRFAGGAHAARRAGRPCPPSYGGTRGHSRT